MSKKIGDVVYLKGGCHPMTVTETKDGDVRCHREDPDAPMSMRWDWYPEAALELLADVVKRRKAAGGYSKKMTI